MARWKILTPHYLRTTMKTVWEYQETDRQTMRQVKRQFEVPRYIDPEDPQDWTVTWGPRGAEDGEVIVCLPGKGEPRDIEFLGDPTPDMIPVDDEAAKISAEFAGRWKAKPEYIGDYSQSLIDDMHEQIAAVAARPAQVEGLSELVGAIHKLVDAVEPAIRRRV